MTPNSGELEIKMGQEGSSPSLFSEWILTISQDCFGVYTSYPRTRLTTHDDRCMVHADGSM